MATIDNTLPPLETQTAWLFQEMSTGDGGQIAQTFRSNTGMSASEAAVAFENQFERSGGSNVSGRINFANDVFSAYSNGNLTSLPSNAQYVFNQALANGYTPQQAAGIVGNLQAESGVNINPYIVNEIGASGIAQWLGVRRDNLRAFDPASGEVVPNEFVQEGDIVNGQPVTAEEAEAIRDAAAGGEPGGGGGGCASAYTENVLNKFDSYTYNWTVHMVHPLNAHQDPASLIGSSSSVILSQSGVDNEVSIEAVVQELHLGYSRENRQAVANRFAFTFLEPGGATMFNRILFAAEQLGIENHLDACYILELNLIGWIGDRSETVGPYLYTTKLLGLTFEYRDGASTYYGDFVEVSEDAFQRLELHLKQETIISGVRTFGDFLGKFQEEHNRQLEEQAARNFGMTLPDRYVFTETAGWGGWEFDAITTNRLRQSRGISVSGNGTLTFTLAQGTAINSAIAMALFQTEKFKRIATNAGFLKDDPNEGEAQVPQLAELVKWVIFNTQVQYLEYDVLAKRYQKRITYSADGYLTPEATHDPSSFLNLYQSTGDQQNRLRNIFSQGLLRKRFDYSFTGLNTEVLDLDIKLDQAYYVIQALNSGRLRNLPDLFTGSSFSGQEENNRLKQEAARAMEAAAQLRAQVADLRVENDSLREQLAGQIEPPAAVAIERQISSNLDSIRELGIEISRQANTAETQFETVAQNLRDLLNSQNTVARNLPTVSNRYITQSQLYAGGGSSSSSATKEDLPATFEYVPVNSLANLGPEKPNDDIGSSMLGAMELNLNAIGDLMKQQIFVRGDPYWLGKNGGAPYQVGGNLYFLNTNFPTYPNEQSGLIESLSSNREDGNFSITGLYRVITVQARYENGQFVMLLGAFRDVNTNSELLFEELMKGCVSGGSASSGVPNRTGGANETAPVDTDGDGIPDTPADNVQPANGNDFSGNHRLAPDLQPALSDLLTQTANETGVTLQTTSGVRTEGNINSGRHTHGNASDTALFLNGRQLSVANPSDRAIIQQFSQNFYNNARSQGYNPSIGWADHTAPQGNWYMNGNVGHFDIASGRNVRPDGRQIYGGYWGNGESSAGAPTWLSNIYR
jgi:hypothetical protein